MSALLDTHFVLWTVLGAPRLEEFPWLERYRPWAVSPVSFLEIQFLGEVGRLEVRTSELTEAVGRDPRFAIDEVPLMSLVQHALPMTWTRDPFDRLIAAHSRSRRLPLCSLDRQIRDEHSLIVRELE